MKIIIPTHEQLYESWCEKQAAQIDPVHAALSAYHHDSNRPEVDRMRDAILAHGHAMANPAYLECDEPGCELYGIYNWRTGSGYKRWTCKAYMVST